MLSRCPWGRNECVTNKLQRASAGRLMCGMLPKSIDRKRCIYNLKAVLGDLRSEGNKLQCRQKVLKFWHFPTHRIPMLPIFQHSNRSFHPTFPPPPPTPKKKKKGLAGLQHCFFGGKGKGLYNQECFKELFFFKLDLQHALIFSWHFVQDCSLLLSLTLAIKGDNFLRGKGTWFPMGSCLSVLDWIYPKHLTHF